MLLGNFSKKNAIRWPPSDITEIETYLIAGGAPAGINMPTPDLGCLTNSTKIKTTTMHGNKRTTPNGIAMLELPLNLSGRRKKANLEVCLGFILTSSITGRLGAEGKRFQTLCTKPIDGDVFVNGREKLDLGVRFVLGRQ